MCRLDALQHVGKQPAGHGLKLDSLRSLINDPLSQWLFVACEFLPLRRRTLTSLGRNCRIPTDSSRRSERVRIPATGRSIQNRVACPNSSRGGFILAGQDAIPAGKAVRRDHEIGRRRRAPIDARGEVELRAGPPPPPHRLAAPFEGGELCRRETDNERYAAPPKARPPAACVSRRRVRWYGKTASPLIDRFSYATRCSPCSWCFGQNVSGVASLRWRIR